MLPKATAWHRDADDQGNERRIRPKTIGQHELAVPLPTSFDPQAPTRFRVCNVNVTGRACTTALSARMLSDATPAKANASAASAAVAEADSPRVRAANPTTTLYRPEAKGPPTSITTRGRSIMQPATRSAATDAAADGLQIICRGGGSFGLERMDDALAKALQRDPTRPTYALYFITTKTAPDMQGNGLLPGTCGIVGQPWPGGGPAIRFYEEPTGEFFYGKRPVLQASGRSIESSFYLDRPDHFWLFQVKEGYGFYEASTHGPVRIATTTAASPRGRASEATPAKENGPITIEAVGVKTLKSPRRAAALEAANTNDVASRVVAAAPAVVQVQETSARGATSSPAISQPIRGVSRSSVASSLEMDCARHPPRVHQVRTVRPGEQFTIDGACLGAEIGTVEITGLPNGPVRPTFVSWTNLSIVALMPPMTSLNDATIAITVQRKSDRAASVAHQARFVVPRLVLNVPAQRWTPMRFSKKETRTANETGRWGDENPLTRARMPDDVAQFKAQINANCAFDSLGVTASVGGIREIRGWDQGPPHQADVSIPWSAYCKGERRNSLDVTATEYELTCEIDIALQATAVCPAGIAP
jgi:hypothetical protein